MWPSAAFSYLTPAWSKHLRALKAAYASHAACKRRGIVQTAKATMVRMAKHRRRQQAEPATFSAVQQAPASCSTSTTVSNISAARAYTRPIGRDARLADRSRR